MLSLYPRLLKGHPHHLAETKFPYHELTERHLQVMWLEQKYFKGLSTESGQTIEVISPGIWNLQAGPDFQKAQIRIGDKIFHGDVEIHLADEGWYQHRHENDPRYNQVVLHLSFWKAKQTKPLLKQNGESLVKAYLEPFLTISINRILRLIDLELYPYKKFLGSGMCAKEVFFGLPKEKIQAFFASAADWRMIKKNEKLKLKMDDPSLCLEAGLAMVLGYKHNTENFFELYIHLQKHRYLSQDSLVSLALGITGFFSDFYQKKWKTNPYYLHLNQVYEDLPKELVLDVPLNLSPTRPLNHPIRRIAFLCKLLRSPQKDLLHDIDRIWTQSWKPLYARCRWKIMRDEMIKRLPTFEESYWNQHYLFEERPSKTFLSLSGTDIMIKMLTNVIMPMLHHEILARANQTELQAFHSFFASLPSEKSGKGRYLGHRFFGATDKTQLFRKAAFVQGAFQVHQDFCVHYEASCEGCPFPERYLEIQRA